MRFRSSIAPFLCLLMLIVAESRAIAHINSRLPGSQRTGASRQSAPGEAAIVKALHMDHMKLLTSTSGWASSGNRLLMTTDLGRHWKDISPPPRHHPVDEALLNDRFTDIFFLDPDVGWALSRGAENDEYDFLVNATTDGGAHWTASQVRIQLPDPSHGGPQLNGEANFVFSDRLHGWLSVDTSSNTLNTSSTLLATLDGGKTWAPTKNGCDGTIDAMRAAGKDTLWLLCRFGNTSELLVSRNGANTFEDAAISMPRELAPAEASRYESPVFVDNLHGYEAVTYTDFSKGVNWMSTIVLFETRDGGRKWTSHGKLSGLRDEELVNSSVADSIWIVPFSTNGVTPAVRTIPANASSSAEPHNPGDFARCLLSFNSSTIGWANCSGQLSVTTDGGTSWTDISPHVRNGALTGDVITALQPAKPVITHEIKTGPRKGSPGIYPRYFA